MSEWRTDYIISIYNHSARRIINYRFYGSEEETRQKINELVDEDFVASEYNYRDDYEDEFHSITCEIRYAEDDLLIYKAIPICDLKHVYNGEEADDE